MSEEGMTTLKEAALLKTEKRDLDIAVIRLSKEFRSGKLTVEGLKAAVLKRIRCIPGDSPGVVDFRRDEEARFISEFEAKRGQLEKAERRLHKKAEKKTGVFLRIKNALGLEVGREP